MNYDRMKRTMYYCAILICAGMSLTCNESLPVYVFPKNVLSLNITTIEQLSDRIAPPGSQAMHFILSGENIYDEVFQDSVDFKGTLRIWWKRKPNRFRTIYLTQQHLVNKTLVHNGKMLLVPGQQFTMDAVWNLKSDDSLYLVKEMNFVNLRKRSCDYNIACSDPEEFVVEASLNVYDRLGYISAPSASFSFVGRRCAECGVGPVCPPPPGGCGGTAAP